MTSLASVTILTSMGAMSRPEDRRITLRLSEEQERDLAACLAIMAEDNEGHAITITDTIAEALRRMAQGE